MGDRQTCKQPPYPHSIPGMYNTGKNLAQWFLFCLVVSCFAAYIAVSTLATGTAGLQVFRVVGTMGFMAYASGQ